MVVPNLYRTQYFPYPIFITIKNIITVDLNYAFDQVQNALWPYPSCCALKMHQLYVKTVVRDFNFDLDLQNPKNICRPDITAI